MKLKDIIDLSAEKDLIEMILTGSKGVVLYGMGEVAERELDGMKAAGIQILYGVDQNSDKWGKQLKGIEIRKPEECVSTELPVLVMTKDYYFEAWKCLKQLGVKTIIPFFYYLYDCEISEENKRYYKTWKQKIDLIHSREVELLDKEAFMLDSLELHITERCSLKCKECCNLMQYFQTPEHADYNEMIDSVDRILDVVDGCYELRLLGGEPFVCTQLGQYIKHYAKHEKIASIVVLTNGTVVPAGENLSELKNDKVLVTISDYGATSRKVAELVTVFEENQINYAVIDTKEWFRCADLTYRNLTEAQLETMYQCCCSSYLLSVKDGRLYTCPYAASAAKLRAVPEDVNEYVDILNTPMEDLREAVKNSLSRKYLKVCNYCMGRPIGKKTDILAAEQTKQPLPYKKY